MSGLLRNILAGSTLVALTSFGTPRLQAITLDFSSIIGASVRFNGTGDTFDFRPLPSGDQLVITLSDGVGDAVGDFGRMDGTFTIGAITTVGSVQTASVTGVGILTIHDGLGSDLKASLVWDAIQTSGAGGTINVNGVLNLSGIAYAGTELDLIALRDAQAGSGSDVVTFQFRPGKSLTALTANGKINSTSFSGTLQATPVPDGGLTLSLLGVALMGVEGLRRKLKK